MEEIVNKVLSSGLIQIDLEEFYHPGERLEYDLKQNLYMELILKEKDFREFLKTNDWEAYRNKNIAIVCTADAIIPTWAYMLLATKLQKVAHKVVVGNLETLEIALYNDYFSTIYINDYLGAKIVIKGCSKVNIPNAVYFNLTQLLLPVSQSIMFGEPCSTVPVYKQVRGDK